MCRMHLRSFAGKHTQHTQPSILDWYNTLLINTPIRTTSPVISSTSYLQLQHCLCAGTFKCATWRSAGCCLGPTYLKVLQPQQSLAGIHYLLPTRIDWALKHTPRAHCTQKWGWACMLASQPQPTPSCHIYKLSHCKLYNSCKIGL
jgi:hypothetical protein